MPITTDQKLDIYNGALQVIGETSLASVTENRKARHDLDGAYNRGAIKNCLASGFWTWAKRTVKLEADPDIDLEFGYSYAFALPADYVRMMAISTDETFATTLEAYELGAGYLFCDSDAIYVSYVSSDDAYGFDYTQWTEHFKEYVHIYLALKVKKVLTGISVDNGDRNDLKAALLSAVSKDAMNKPVKYAPTGGWVLARTGRGRPSINVRTIPNA